ncbi:flagellar basal body P-ring protein FlgI [Legionella hackeliae]|uniref:Flagellar P-ring protein n=1 Tax=Legionella hackeliae TaxID=449 RepID=A0A0A8UVC9_LEGHA|nr:flagellar basal body P-ring protein FlgI [Legionella hackeliae]KTD09626.1 flagellar P-ring protein (precursor) FlgI [Legionella hackeliae]CEK11057.1 flagellar basal body P-ring protein [Legionella hackeliae]STX47804.1 flagellar P-ring protein (precursor) FlgI [Legionella hackeliae]
MRKAIIAFLVVFIPYIVGTVVYAERIKDIATLAGVRINQLIGYGLVVGLDGTGDRTGTRFTEQSFGNMLIQLGINIPPGMKLNSKNIAAVMVTANLSTFMKKGQTLDVNVSSIGDSKSLRGGTLLMTPLKGADGRVYAMAQGNITVVALAVSGEDGSSVTVNVPSGGRIANGATVEVDIPNPFYFSKTLTYNLHFPDFTTAKRMSDAINQLMGPGTAHPIDAASVEVTAPKTAAHRVEYVSVLENIEFTPGEAEARIIINPRTGTVVIGQQVLVKPAAVSHGNLVVTISENPIVSQPNPFAGGRTVVVPDSQINVSEKNNRTFLFAPGASLKDIVRAINAVGATPGDLVAILEALKQVGALNATIIII